MPTRTGSSQGGQRNCVWALLNRDVGKTCIWATKMSGNGEPVGDGTVFKVERTPFCSVARGPQNKKFFFKIAMHTKGSFPIGIPQKNQSAVEDPMLTSMCPERGLD